MLATIQFRRAGTCRQLGGRAMAPTATRIAHARSRVEPADRRQQRTRELRASSEPSRFGALDADSRRHRGLAPSPSQTARRADYAPGALGGSRYRLSSQRVMGILIGYALGKGAPPPAREPALASAVASGDRETFSAGRLRGIHPTPSPRRARCRSRARCDPVARAAEKCADGEAGSHAVRTAVCQLRQGT